MAAPKGEAGEVVKQFQLESTQRVMGTCQKEMR